MIPHLLSIPAEMVEYIGYFGSFLTAITFVPQVYKSWQSKSVGDLSSWMVAIVITSAAVWLVYAFAINSGPVIVANCIVLVLTLVLLYFKFRFREQGTDEQGTGNR